MKNVKLKLIREQIKQSFLSQNIEVIDIDYIISNVINIPIKNLFLVDKISLKEYKKILKLTKKRLNGCPITEVFNKAYFYGYEFFVNKHVLSCRQDTEILIETAENNIPKTAKVLDLCTGSGCIGITLNLLGYDNVDCADISSKAIKVSKKNAKKLKANVKIFKSDLFKNISKKYDLIISNPPYIKTDDINELSTEVKNYDPLIALDGGEDGLKFYRLIVKELNNHLAENGKVIFEIGYNQAKEVAQLLEEENFKVKVIKDYSGNDRVVFAEKNKGENENVR